MPDITIQIIINKSAHALASSNEMNRWDLGEILDGWLASTHANFDGNDWHMNDAINSPRCGFVHITDVPASKALMIRDQLMEQPYNTETGSTIRRRRWFVDHILIPIAAKQRLLADREITVTWDAAKAVIRDAIDNVSLT